MPEDKDTTFGDWMNNQREADSEAKRIDEIAAALHKLAGGRPPVPGPQASSLKAPKLPEYVALKVYSYILVFLGLLVIAIGCVVVLRGLISDRVTVASGLGVALTGLGMAAVGELLRAIRDIARNSFKL